MNAIPIDVMFWPSLAALGAGILALVPIWLRGRAERAGRVTPDHQVDVTQRNVACVLLLGGFMGLVATGLTKASRELDFSTFVIAGGAWLAALLAIAFLVDARARRHR